MNKQNRILLNNLTQKQLERLSSNKVDYHEISANKILYKNKELEHFISEPIQKVKDELIGHNKNVMKFSPNIIWSLINETNNVAIGISKVELKSPSDKKCRINISSNLIGISYKLNLSDDSKSTNSSICDSFDSSEGCEIMKDHVITSFNDYVTAFIDNQIIIVDSKFCEMNVSNNIYWERLFQANTYEVSLDHIVINISNDKLIFIQKIQIQVPEIFSLQDALKKKYFDMFSHDLLVNYM